MLSIIILNYKLANLIKYQLRELTSYNFSFESEIIVVDNDSHDNIAIVMKEFDGVRFIQAGSNKGCGAGNNVAIKQAKGEYILILNPDIRISKSTIEYMYNFLKNHEKIGIVAPRLINGDSTLQETCFRFPNIFYPLFRRTILSKTNVGKKWLDDFLMRDINHESTQEVDWVMGSCYMTRKKNYENINYFDEGIFLYLEDIDVCRRMWESGYSVYYLGAVSATHLHQQASRNKTNVLFSILFNKLTRAHIKSWLYYVKKNRGKVYPLNCPSSKRD